MAYTFPEITLELIDELVEDLGRCQVIYAFYLGMRLVMNAPLLARLIYCLYAAAIVTSHHTETPKTLGAF